MKNHNSILFVIFITISSFFFGCSNISITGKGDLKFDSIQIEKEEHLFSDTSKPSCNLHLTLTYPIKSSDKVLQDSITTYFVALTLGEKYMNQTPQQAVKAYATNYASTYRKDLEPTYQQDEKENPDVAQVWYSYYKNIKSNIKTYTGNLLTYQIYYDEFTGGAHGIYMTTYKNFDLRLMRPIGLSDLFTENYEEVLTDLIWNQLMSDNEVSSHEELEELGYGSTGDIQPTENFYLDDYGIHFHYNVYDITPYAMGAVKVSIPYQLLEPIIGSNDLLTSFSH